MLFIQAKNYTPASRTGQQINLIVIHDEESPQGVNSAEDVANYFAGPNAPQASAHCCADENTIVRCVYSKDIAWAAPNANTRGYHIEHAGYAAQTKRVWLDANNRKMLEHSASWAATKAKQFDITITHLTDYALIKAACEEDNGPTGFVGHKNVSAMSAHYNLPGDHSHTDPGDNFPWGYYLDLVKHYHSKL